MRPCFGDAVVVLKLVGQLQRTAGLTLRIFRQRNNRRTVRDGAELPLWLTGWGPDLRGAIARDGEMPLIGTFRRLLGGLGLGQPAAGEYLECAPAWAHDQRTASRNGQWSCRWETGLLVCRG